MIGVIRFWAQFFCRNICSLTVKLGAAVVIIIVPVIILPVIVTIIVIVLVNIIAIFIVIVAVILLRRVFIRTVGRIIVLLRIVGVSRPFIAFDVLNVSGRVPL